MYIETKKQHVRVSKLYFDISAFVYSFKSVFDLTYVQTHRINTMLLTLVRHINHLIHCYQFILMNICDRSISIQMVCQICI